QLAFLGRHLRDDDAAPLPRVRLEVQESRNQIVTVRDEPSWPLESPRWTPLHLTNAGLSPDPAAEEGTISFDTRSRGTRFGWTVPPRHRTERADDVAAVCRGAGQPRGRSVRRCRKVARFEIRAL